jgi:hypothetical protein
MPKIDITKGFQIDEPLVFIPWDIEEATVINDTKGTPKGFTPFNIVTEDL